MPAKRIKNYFVNPKNKFDYSRNAFPYSRTHSTNLLTGAIVPVAYLNCAPGITVPNKFGFILQSAPLLGPTVDNCYIDIIAVWIPTRLVMADFNEWLGDNDTLAWTLFNNVHLPRLDSINTRNPMALGGSQAISKTYFAEHYLAPHFGFRFFGQQSGFLSDGSGIVGVNSVFSKGIQVIPSRMYDLVYNTMFRNENIQNPILFSKQSGTNLSLDAQNYRDGMGKIHFANRLKDVYNQARLGPSIQTVDIGLGADLPVITGAVDHDIGNIGLRWRSINSGSVALSRALGINSAGDTCAYNGGTPAGSGDESLPANLYADLSQLTVNSLYYSIMLQKYMNKASSGRRPIEFYKTFFGISRSDAAHDDPELLCQKRYKVNISRVVATANSDDASGNNQGLGTQGAFSLTSVGGTLFPEFTATEYGMLQVYAVIRTQESYASGIDKYLGDYDLLSTYLPVFDHIGEESIELNEIANYINQNYEDQKIFGYQEAWYRYRYQVNDAVGIFSPGEALDYMTFARDFDTSSTAFTVNDNFIKQHPAEFDRMLQLPVFYGTPSSTGIDAYGEPYNSDRYQWVIQFALAGDLIATMSKDSDPLLFGNRI